MIKTLAVIMLLVYPVSVNAQVLSLSLIAQNEQQTWICPKCGAENPISNKFCTECGNPGPGAQPGSYQQRSEILDLIAQAEADAQNDTNSLIWGGAGCLLGIIGVGVAAVVEPSVPSARVVNISPQEINAYTSAYKSKAKSIQLKHAAGGCLLGTGLAILIIALTSSD